MKRELLLFIEDILENISNIELFMHGVDKEKFLKNEEKQYAVLRALEIIGEAVKNIPEDFRKKYPTTPWRDIAGFRDVLIHSYFGVNLDRVWKIVKDDIPMLRNKILEIRRILLKKKESEKEEK